MGGKEEEGEGGGLREWGKRRDMGESLFSHPFPFHHRDQLSMTFYGLHFIIITYFAL